MQTILVALISGLIFAGWIPACMMMDKLKKGRKKRPFVCQRKRRTQNVVYIQDTPKGA
ncbi:hypothetical protein H8702_07855 [Massilimaliae timonensis]|jgi:hypothetical protein|uniref:Uncharacterized protein n=1 Tax=Massiliimalia timonensis TaxID=1987501 RepID=A0A8J6TXD9_9FIRM|nr:hypothetical protein [Massiliimalia timonensis]MBC8611035.1 hypothetical protein [Massiliimalia timonensis]